MESTMISLPPAPEISEISEMRDVPKEHQPDQRLVLKRSTAALQDMGIVIDPRDLKTTIQKQMGQLVVHMATGQHQLELALARTFFCFFSFTLSYRTCNLSGENVYIRHRSCGNRSETSGDRCFSRTKRTGRISHRSSKHVLQ